MTSIAAIDMLPKKSTSDYNSNFGSEVSQHRVIEFCSALSRVALKMSGNGSSLIPRVSSATWNSIGSAVIVLMDSTAHCNIPVLSTVHMKTILSPIHTAVAGSGVENNSIVAVGIIMCIISCCSWM